MSGLDLVKTIKDKLLDDHVADEATRVQLLNDGWENLEIGDAYQKVVLASNYTNRIEQEIEIMKEFVGKLNNKIDRLEEKGKIS